MHKLSLTAANREPLYIAEAFGMPTWEPAHSSTADRWPKRTRARASTWAHIMCAAAYSSEVRILDDHVQSAR